MRLGDAVVFAARAVSGHRRRSSFAMLGVAIGVTAVVVLTALGEGARGLVVRQFAALGSNLLIVTPGKTETTGAFPGLGFGTPHDLTLEDVRALQREVPQATRIAPVLLGNETVAWRDRRRQVAVMGATSELREVRKLEVSSGEFLPRAEWEHGASVVVLGSKAARELFGTDPPLGKVVRIGDWRMRVVGVLAPRGVHMGADMDEIVIVPVSTAMRMFDRRSLARVLIEVKSSADLPAAQERVVALLRERHDEEDVTCLTQDAVIGSLSSILSVLTAALSGIAAISLFVAGIGIMNVMLVSVSERTREIGLLKALGARSRDILSVFVVESALLAILGGGAGVALGWLSSVVFTLAMPAFPVTPPPWAVIAALCTSAILGVLFGSWPAWKATRLEPTAALARAR